MGWVAPEQIERARQIPVLAYILAHEWGEYKRVGTGYRLKADDAFAVDEKGWYCHKRNVGGYTALDYLVEMKGYGLVEAVCTLLGERSQEHSNRTITPKATPPSERLPFALPLRSKDNKRIIAYLQSRGIDRDLIIDCIERGVLFESKYYHNAVFLGKDERGKTRFAAMRSATTNFMRDADGSDKKYGFTLPPDHPNSNEVAVFESPIDCLSHQTLCKQGHIPAFDGWRLSLGGTSTVALEHFLKQHPQITHCLICTDNDKGGNMVAEKIAAIPGISSERAVPTRGSDWNDNLQVIKRTEHTTNRARDMPSL